MGKAAPGWRHRRSAAPAVIQLLTKRPRISRCVRDDVQPAADSTAVCLAGEIKAFVAVVLWTLFHHPVSSLHPKDASQIRNNIF